MNILSKTQTNLGLNQSLWHLFIAITGSVTLSSSLLKADDIIHNETGKYGKAQEIIVYTSDEPAGVKLAPNESRKFKVDGDNEYIAWKIGADTVYTSHLINKPKDTYIYSDGKYLTWTWFDTGTTVLGIKISKPTESAITQGVKINIADLKRAILKSGRKYSSLHSSTKNENYLEFTGSKTVYKY